MHSLSSRRRVSTLRDLEAHLSACGTNIATVRCRKKWEKVEYKYASGIYWYIMAFLEGALDAKCYRMAISSWELAHAHSFCIEIKKMKIESKSNRLL